MSCWRISAAACWPGLRSTTTVLRAIRPEIILASISSQGESRAPDANYVSFGTTLEAMAGLAWQTGYPEGDPTVSGRDLNYPDQVVAIFAAGMVAAAWRHRCRTGQGAHLDMSQRELTSFLVGEAFGAAGSHPARQGNADPAYVLQECFRTADGTWLALSVLPDQAAALDALATARALPLPIFNGTRLAGWVGEPAFADREPLVRPFTQREQRGHRALGRERHRVHGHLDAAHRPRRAGAEITRHPQVGRHGALGRPSPSFFYIFTYPAIWS